MMRTLVAALTACLVCLSLAGCDSESDSGDGGSTGARREVSAEARPAPGGGTTSMVPLEETEEDSPDE